MSANTRVVTTRVTRIGNSKGIIIPTQVVKALALQEGDSVNLSYDQTTQVLSVTFPTIKQLVLSANLHNS